MDNKQLMQQTVALARGAVVTDADDDPYAQPDSAEEGGVPAPR
jgi:hypothetical protein